VERGEGNAISHPTEVVIGDLRRDYYIRFVECRRPSRKKLPISNPGSRLGRDMTQLHLSASHFFLVPFISFAYRKTDHAHNFSSFCHFFFSFLRPDQSFQTCDDGDDF